MMLRVLMLLLTVCFCGAAPNEILLHASKAIVHGEKLRYEPETNKITLGYWTVPTDWAEWNFDVDRPGVFELEVWQGCGKGQGGSEVRVEVAGQRFEFVVDETGHFQSFIPRKPGRIHFPVAGRYNLAIRPQNKKAAAVMDVRQVKLLPVTAAGETQLESDMLGARRIVFLGDSITYSGEYVEFVEAYLRLKYPEAEFDIINLALPSETVSGLSEPGHAGGAFPRPDLHERLDRVLQKAKPDLVFACYGMNDGIYYPLSEERFERFRAGIIALHDKAVAAGAKIIHLTPPVFDPVPLKGGVLPAGLRAYPKPFESYNDVLNTFSDWLISKHADGWDVIDIHGPMNAALAERRRDQPDFRFANDGVHASREGHWLMAQTLLGEFGEEDSIWKKLSPRAEEVLALVQQRQRLRKDAWLTDIGHKRPGMNPGKPLAEAESTAGEIALKLAAVQDPQLAGERVHWNGFERCDSVIHDVAARIVLPRRPGPVRVWLPVESLEKNLIANLRAAGEGFHIIEVDSNAIPALEKELVSKYGFESREFSERLRPVIEKAVSGPRDELGRPLIRKLGTVDLDLVETTPVAFGNRLWRFEWVREGYWNNQRKTNYFRFRDPQTGEVTDSFADGHEFGSAFVHDGTVYVTGTHGRGEVNLFASRDLKSWEKWNVIPAGKYGIFNTSLCKAGDEFVLMFEIDKPAEEAGKAFTARFAKSSDLRAWRMTPPECNYSKDRYTAPHALRWLDGWFYNFYLEAHEGYEMRVVRSRDLVKWEASPLNPVLQASADDRRIASAGMPQDQRTRVANAVNINNSDIDFCEFNGQLHITYSWGNQHGTEHLAEAVYDGSEAEFLKGWFPSAE